MPHLARFLIACAIAACADPARPPPSNPSEPTTPAVEPTPAPVAQPVMIKRVVISSARKSGTYVVTTGPDGTIKTSLFVLQNGRGPKVEATQRLAADGTLASFSATGQHEMSTKVAETFTREGDLAR